MKEGQKEGFVVCLIPEGTAKAHRAESSNRQFYMRMLDSFDVPPVAVIRSLFYPQVRASLVPYLVTVPKIDRNEIQFGFCVKNEGSLTAREIFALLSHDEEIQFVPTETSHARSADGRLHGDIPLKFSGNLNPGIAFNPFFVLTGVNRTAIRKGVTFGLQMSCENTALEAWGCDVGIEALTRKMTIPFVLDTR